MRTVFKYQLSSLYGNRTISVSIPEDSLFLKAGIKDSTLCVWFEVETSNSPEDYTFHIYGTGVAIPENSESKMLYHLETIFDGTFVWHLYLEDEVT